MMKGKTLEELCDRVKRKCGITWNDEDTEQKIRDIVPVIHAIVFK